MGNARWLAGFGSNPQAPVRLVGLPHAGGGTVEFRDWAGALPTVEVQGLRLPGREHRVAEPFAVSVQEVVGAVAAELERLPSKPEVFFGHSLGALMAFELARLRPPTTLIVSGARTPDAAADRITLHTATDAALVEQLRAWGGTPPELFEHQELLDLVLPILRADLSLGARYSHRPGPPLDCPMLALAGADDEDAPPEAVAEWASFCAAEFRHRVLPGGHFFINTATADLLELLAIECTAVTA